MYLTGFADEAAVTIDEQLRAIKALGWDNIESRNIDGKLIYDLSDQQLDIVCEKLCKAGIHVNCVGSAVANWGKKLSDPPQSSYDELERAIRCMRKLGTGMIRVMSFAVPEDASINEPVVVNEVINRMKVLARIAEDNGILLLHENCDNWGGRSFEHTLRLMDAVHSPALRLVFDTGNPVFRKDIRGEPPFSYQSAWEFYQNVKEFVDYVHIKDGRMIGGKVEFTFPGEGDGNVREIVTDLLEHGYDGGISIEPHLAVVFHDSSVTSDSQVRYNNFVEYGRRMETLINSIKHK